jgi:hypothetical protein
LGNCAVPTDGPTITGAATPAAKIPGQTAKPASATIMMAVARVVRPQVTRPCSTPAALSRVVDNRPATHPPNASETNAVTNGQIVFQGLIPVEPGL